MTIYHLKYIILSLTILLAIDCFSQNEKAPEAILFPIGEFKSREQMFKADAYVSCDTTVVYLYRLEATHTYPANFYYGYKPKIYISCTETMVQELMEIDSIYRSWTNIAIKNEVGKMEKEIEADFPIYMYSLHKKTGVPDRYKPFNNHKFTFKIYDVSKEPSVFCNDEFPDDGTRITVSIGLAFNSTKDFSDFVNFLRPDGVIQKIKAGQASLFSQGEPVTGQYVQLPQFTELKKPVKVTSVWQDKNKRGQIANEALNRWVDNAKKASKIK